MDILKQSIRYPRGPTPNTLNKRHHSDANDGSQRQKYPSFITSTLILRQCHTAYPRRDALVKQHDNVYILFLNLYSRRIQSTSLFRMFLCQECSIFESFQNMNKKERITSRTVAKVFFISNVPYLNPFQNIHINKSITCIVVRVLYSYNVLFLNTFCWITIMWIDFLFYLCEFKKVIFFIFESVF